MIHLVNASKANARLNGRSSVTVEDVRDMAPFVLLHRIVVRGDTKAETVLLDSMAGVPTAVPPPVSPVS
jgi:Mg-chelatase subunit ChlI